MARYYRRVGRRSGVSMGIGTYLVAIIISGMVLAVAVATYWEFIVGALVVGAIIWDVLSEVATRKRAKAVATKAAADKAWLEENLRRVGAQRDGELEQAKALADQAMQAGKEERRVLLAQARALVTSKGGNTSWDLHPEGKLALARYVDQKCDI